MAEHDPAHVIRLYRDSQMGVCLDEALGELAVRHGLSKELHEDTMAQFDHVRARAPLPPRGTPRVSAACARRRAPHASCCGASLACALRRGRTCSLRSRSMPALR